MQPGSSAPTSSSYKNIPRSRTQSFGSGRTRHNNVPPRVRTESWRQRDDGKLLVESNLCFY